jgi:hypothetical protein
LGSKVYNNTRQKASPYRERATYRHLETKRDGERQRDRERQVKRETETNEGREGYAYIARELRQRESDR